MRPARVAARAVPRPQLPTSVLSSPPPSPPEEGVELPGIPVKMKTRLKHPSMKALPAPTQLPAMGPPSSRNFLPALTKGKAVRGAGSSNVDTSTELATFNTPNTDAPLRLRADSPDPTDTLDPMHRSVGRREAPDASDQHADATEAPAWVGRERRARQVDGARVLARGALARVAGLCVRVERDRARAAPRRSPLERGEEGAPLLLPRRPQVDAFFGVPEYIIFPTMLTGPVFFTPVLEGGFHDFPSFERTYHQLRDLLCFVAATLGLVWVKQLDAILEAVNAIGEALNRQMLRGWPNTPDAPVKLREALVDLLVQLYRWQGHAAATAEPPNPGGEKTMEFAAETLEVLREFFRALGVALQVDDRELERHLDPASREEIYEDTFIAPATKLDDLEKRKTRSTCNRYTFSRKTGAAQKVEEEVPRRSPPTVGATPSLARRSHRERGQGAEGTDRRAARQSVCTGADATDGR